MAWVHAWSPPQPCRSAGTQDRGKPPTEKNGYGDRSKDTSTSKDTQYMSAAPMEISICTFSIFEWLT